MTDSEAQGTEARGKTVHAVERAIDVLEIVASERRIGVSEIALRLGVHKSTVSRLITSLQQRGFVEEAGVRGKYQLGFAVVRLAEATVAQSGLVEIAQPECDRLADASGRPSTWPSSTGPARSTCSNRAATGASPCDRGWVR